MDKITVRDANEHNLSHVSLSIPRDKLVVFTGVSGSGKSSLAFDTIFSEGQRRYVESLNAYARQFIGQYEKPDVESVDGLSPAVAIDQKSTSRSPRSTVGTVTEIYDYLRLLYAKIGIPHCPETGVEITPHTMQSILDDIRRFPEGSRLQVLSPVVRGRKGEYNALFQQLRKEGYVRVRIDGELQLLEELPEDYRLARNKLHDIDVVIDRVVYKDEDRVVERLTEAVENAMKKSDGYLIVQDLARDGTVNETFYSRHLASPYIDIGFQEMSPRLFSFNSPYGACPTCEGLGVTYEIAENLLVPDPKKSLAEGAIAPFEKFTGRYYPAFIKKLGKRYDIDVDKPYRKLSEKDTAFLLYGPPQEEAPKGGYAICGATAADDEEDTDWFNLISDFDGVINIMRRRLLYGSEATRSYIRTFMQEHTCPACGGARLKPFSLQITLGKKKRGGKKDGLNIDALCRLPINESLRFIRRLPENLSDYEMTIARQPLREVEQRLEFLLDVGLDYLTLSRPSATLSGGEAQRIRLASQIGSGLSGVLYILDEPSIGLHQHNNLQLIQTLCKLRDQGNSVIVVEHDEDTIRTADWVVDIGPGAGIHGGRIVAEGDVGRIQKNRQSLTGQYLSGKRQIPVPKNRREGTGNAITVKNAAHHNLQGLTVDFPLGKLIGISGISGSGKSTLVFDVLYEGVRYELGRFLVRPPGYEAIDGLEYIDKIMSIDQSPIGRSSRSNPATYTGVFDIIRNVFTNTEDAKVRGYKPGRFSFNVKGGRCDACNGEGEIVKEMNFLPNVHLVCDVCGGKRYNVETLQVKYHGKTIADVLGMTVEEACEFFADQTRIARYLTILKDVGLGYIQLGQPATTLSGGEAQRIKLATEFCKRATGKTLYVLDEPSIGLHWVDLENLITIFNRLVDQGNTVVIIEHNLDIIKVCDHVIDLGPEGGKRGGEIIAQGTPEQIAASEDSYTGRYLKPYL